MRPVDDRVALNAPCAEYIAGDVSDLAQVVKSLSAFGCLEERMFGHNAMPENSGAPLAYTLMEDEGGSIVFCLFAFSDECLQTFLASLPGSYPQPARVIYCDRTEQGGRDALHAV